MQTRTLLAATAVAAIAAIATPSISRAQDTTAKKTTTSPGEVAMAPNFGSLISAINSSSKHNDKIKSLTDVNAANVQLVNVDDLLKGNDVNALNNALEKNQADITALQTTLGGNSTINAAITATALPTTAAAATDSTAKAATLTASDVVAADVTPEGKVVLYYWKKK